MKKNAGWVLAIGIIGCACIAIFPPIITPVVLSVSIIGAIIVNNAN